MKTERNFNQHESVAITQERNGASLQTLNQGADGPPVAGREKQAERLTPQADTLPKEGENRAARLNGQEERQTRRSKSVLELPEAEPWPEAVEGSDLLDGLEQALRRFVMLPQWAGETLALWTLHTYAFSLREISTYVGIESPEKRCGKTTLLSVLSALVNRPVVAANISPPAFFRVIEETRPTLLIDEADTLLQGNDELRGILNAGYSRKTAYVVRVARSRDPETDAQGPGPEADAPSSQLARFSCWCPKVMAAIGHLPDTLADRCVVIRMQRETAREECERLRNLEATTLRRQCARFVKDHRGEIADTRPQLPSCLNDRAGDIWEPLLVLADLAGGEWPEKARQAAVGLTSSAQENSPISTLLFDIYVSFTKIGTQRIHSRTLVADLNRLTDRPWMELRKGKGLTELWLAQQLRPYGVRPATLRIGETLAKGYVEEDFMEVFRRYIPKSELVE